MTGLRTAAPASELVPLVERLRYMQLFRMGMVLAVGLFALRAGDALVVGPAGIAVPTAAFVLVSLAAQGLWQLVRRGGITFFGALLIADGFYLAWASYATGGSASPLRYLILLHLIAASLLGSYRTGLKLALWHSLLLWVVYQAQEAGILRPAADALGGLPGSELERLLTFAAMFWFVAIATASFSAINERELRRRKFDLEALAGMADRLEREREPLAVADIVLESVADAFGFERAALVSAEEGNLSLVASRGSVNLVGAAPVPGIESSVRAALESRRTVLVAELDPREDGWLAGVLPEARNLVLVPLSAEGGAVGLLVFEHNMKSGSRIERRVVSMVERFASHGSLTLRNAWLLERLQQTADTDGLTGIANRRTFERTLEREVSRAARTGGDVSLVMLDIDHFKGLNDAHGHQAGDEVLRRVASALVDRSRDFDTPARYGGEEFAVILPGTAAEEARAVAERLHASLRHSIEGSDVTASAGVASFPVNAADAGSLVRAADEALYASKRSGRDRVTASRHFLAGLEHLVADSAG